MTSRRRTLTLLIAAAVCAARIAQAAEDTASPKITGTVVYRERIALPPDAVVHVRLEAAGPPELPPKRIAEITVPTAGRQVPIAFELPYSASAVDPKKRHFVRATITSGDRTLFASRTPYPVLTKGAPSKVEILVQQSGAGKPRPAAPPAGSFPLADSEWKLVALGQTPAAAEPDARPATLAFEGANRRISGSTGCNRFMGTFAPGEGSALKLDPNGMTLMACPDRAMQQESAFLAALRSTTGYRVEGAKLELLDGERVVARFESSGGAGTRSE